MCDWGYSARGLSSQTPPQGFSFFLFVLPPHFSPSCSPPNPPHPRQAVYFSLLFPLCFPSPLVCLHPAGSAVANSLSSLRAMCPPLRQRGTHPGGEGGESVVGRVMGHVWGCRCSTAQMEHSIHTLPLALPSPPPQEGASPSPVLPGCPTPTSPSGTCCVLAQCWDQDWDASERQIPAQIHCPPGGAS